MAALGWLLNLGFAGGTGGADPPTAQPLRAEIVAGTAKNNLILNRSGNTTDPVASKNSVETV